MKRLRAPRRHRSDDGQKGMGLIMLILVGTVPTAYALNHAITAAQTPDFVAVSQQTAGVIHHYVDSSTVIGQATDEVTDFVRTKEFKPTTMLALQQLVTDMSGELEHYKDLKGIP